MRIVIFNWRDLGHARAGGAEYSTHTLCRGLAERGHKVTWFTSCMPGEQREEQRDGYRVVRRGTQLTCRFHAIQWLRSCRNQFDIAIDEVNTLPFFTRCIYDPVVLWIHQLAKEVWLNEAPPGVGHIGYMMEPLLMMAYHKSPIVTVSESSAQSLREFGLRGNITVIENALLPSSDMSRTPIPARIGYVGRVAPSKRIDHIIRAVAIVKRSINEAHLVIIGSGKQQYIGRLKRLANALGIGQAVQFCGRVPDEGRDEILSTLDVLAMASVREGWGLVVSEAARFRVPSAVYPVPGLVDSVQHLSTGIVAEDETPEALAASLKRILVDRPFRDCLAENAGLYLENFSPGRFIDRFERVLIDNVKGVQ